MARLRSNAPDVSIVGLLKLLGTDIPDGIPAGKSWKTWCPWASEHMDPHEKSLRVYPDTNSANCFDVHGRLTPTRIVAISRGISSKDAADLIRATTSPSLEDRWEAALRSIEEARPGNPASELRAAAQDVARTYGIEPGHYRFADYLRLVQTCPTDPTEAEARAWLSHTTAAIEQFTEGC